MLNCDNFIAAVAGSSITNADGEFHNLQVNAKNSAALTLTGMGDKLGVEGSNSSTLNADGISVNVAEVNLSNSALCKINAKDRLKVELINSSHLIYNSNPAIEVERIVNSTMTRSSDTKYNKNK